MTDFLNTQILQLILGPRKNRVYFVSVQVLKATNLKQEKNFYKENIDRKISKLLKTKQCSHRLF